MRVLELDLLSLPKTTCWRIEAPVDWLEEPAYACSSGRTPARRPPVRRSIACGQATLADPTARGATSRDAAGCEFTPRPTGAASGIQAITCLARVLWADGCREVETSRPAADTVCRGVSGRQRATICATRLMGIPSRWRPTVPPLISSPDPPMLPPL